VPSVNSSDNTQNEILKDANEQGEKPKSPAKIHSFLKRKSKKVEATATVNVEF
jgi:hypothetical protein